VISFRNFGDRAFDILKEQDVKKSVDTVKKIVNDLKENKVDINKLVITKSVSRSLKSYKGVQRI